MLSVKVLPKNALEKLHFCLYNVEKYEQTNASINYFSLMFEIFIENIYESMKEVCRYQKGCTFENGE